ncbi:MAG: hypothetical protein M1820_003120 [Bogoriella megaspora]|nr:MAG: hypothetical protein M1820_003120 [Bogoriella megaspora]
MADNSKLDYTPSDTLIDKLTPYVFSKRITQYHCTECGSQMLARIVESGDSANSTVHWDVACGTLEQGEGIYEVQGHEHIADTLDGGFSDFLPVINDKAVERWPHHFREEEQLPLYWQSEERSQSSPSSSDRLRGHCHCGGVEFWIARPSERSKFATGAWPDLLIPHYLDQLRPEGEAWWLQDDGKKFLAGCCACNSCRLAFGMEWIQWAFVPTVDISLDREGKVPFSRNFGTLRHHQSSDEATRHFCGVCGASIFWDGDRRPNLIDVAVGLLTAPEGARAESWLEWRTHRLSFREDAVDRIKSLTLGVEDGLKMFGQRH